MSQSISVVICTSALADHARSTLSSGSQPYSDRVWLLRNVILPCYTNWFPERFREIVVVGEWEPGDGYRHIPFASVYRNCADALLKRQAGYDALTKPTSWVLFQHDDHIWDPRNVVDGREAAYVLSPSRFTRARGAGEPLNDGFNMAFDPRYGYVNGHVCLMKPHVFREGFKWTDAPPVFTWDQQVTALLRDRFPIRYAPELVTYDLERGAEPWT